MPVALYLSVQPSQLYKTTKSAPFVFTEHIARPCVAGVPKSGGAAPAAGPPDDPLMPIDNTGPLGASRRRRSRPADAAVLGALSTGPFGAQAVAVPWAVGFGATGAIADPNKSARPAAGGGGSEDQTQSASSADTLPRLMGKEGDGWRLNYRASQGIPWGIGHWPFTPRLGLGGQVAYYNNHTSAVSQQVPQALAQKVAERLNSWWWPKLHRLGADVGPCALNYPKPEPHTPLTWLGQGDTATLTCTRHELLSIGLVVQWLRIGPQWSRQAGRSLTLTRNGGATLAVAQEDFDCQHQVPMMVDLPIFGMISTARDVQTVHRRKWTLDLASSADLLTYQLLVDSHLRGKAMPEALTGQRCKSSVHKAQSAGGNAAVFLPWTLLSSQVQGLGFLQEEGSAVAVHAQSGLRAHSFWVEGEVESWALGHNAWRIGIHGGHLPHALNGPEKLHVTLRLQVEWLSPKRHRQVFDLLSNAFGAQPIGLNVRFAGTVWPQGLDVHLQFAMPVRALWEAGGTDLPQALRWAAAARDVPVAQVRGLARAMAKGSMAMVEDGDPLLGLGLQQALREAGPEALVLLGRWLKEPHSDRLSVSYAQTEALTARAWTMAALAAGTRPLTLWQRTHALALSTQLHAEGRRLREDPLTALCPNEQLSSQLFGLARARRELTQAIQFQTPSQEILPQGEAAALL